MNESLPFTPRVKKVLSLAEQCAKNVRHNYIGTEHILIGLLTMKDGPAYEFLVQCGVNTESVKDTILNSLSPPLSDYVKNSAEGIIHLLRKAADDLEAESKKP